MVLEMDAPLTTTEVIQRQPAGTVVSNSRASSALIITLLAAITAEGAVLRFQLLTAKSFWFDEGASVGIARLDWYNFVRILWRREANMALYYLLLRGWLHFGSSEWFIRSLSALLGLATIPAVYVLGRRLFGMRAGLIAAALLSVNAFHVRYSQEARSYSLTVLLCVLSSLYFMKYIETHSRRNRIAYVILSSMAVYAHFFSGLVLLAHWISLRFLDPQQTPKQMKKTWLPIAIATFPIFAFVATTGAGPLSWVQRPGLRNLWQTALLMTGSRGPLLVLAFAAACIVAVYSSSSAWKHKQVDWQTWRCRFLLLWLLVPIGLVLIVSFARPLFVPRYFIVSLPALALLAGSGLARIRRMWLVAPILLVFAVTGVRGTQEYYRQRQTSPNDNWRAASQYLVSNARPGEALIFYVSMGRLSYDYYRSLQGAAGPEVIYPHHSPQITFLDFVEKPDYVQLRQTILQHPRVWFVVSHASLTSGRDRTESALAGAIGDMQALVDQRDFGGIQVLLYQTDTSKPLNH
jgi:mannosyltransferase